MSDPIEWLSKLRAPSSRGRVDEVRDRLERTGYRAAAPSVLARAAFGVAIAAAVLVAVLAWPRTEAPLALEVDGVPAVVGAEPATEEHGVELRFTDGTNVEVARRARLRVAELTPRGATLELAAGRVALDVRPRPHAQWSVWAGTVEVRVHGTRFSVERAEDGVQVEVERGLVEVRPDGAPSVWLHDGERYPAAVPVSTPSGPIRAPAHEPTHVDDAVDSETAPPRPLPRGAHATMPDRAPEIYALLVSDGRYADALARLDAQGVEHELGSLPASELVAVGDAARLGRRPREARAAYEALAARFPDASERSRASFALGRVCADALHDEACAIAAFRAVVERAPSSPLATDARGRLLEVLVAAERLDEARSVAASIVERDPDSPRLAAARALLGAP